MHKFIMDNLLFCLVLFINYYMVYLVICIKVKKNPAGQDSPPAAGRFSDIYLSAAVHSGPAGLFYATGDSNGISYCIKKAPGIYLPRSFFKETIMRLLYA